MADLLYFHYFKIRFVGLRDRDEERQDVRIVPLGILHPAVGKEKQRNMVTAVRPGAETGPTASPGAVPQRA